MHAPSEAAEVRGGRRLEERLWGAPSVRANRVGEDSDEGRNDRRLP